MMIDDVWCFSFVVFSLLLLIYFFRPFNPIRTHCYHRCCSHSSCTNFIIFIGFPQEPAQTTIVRIGKEYEEMDDSITMKDES